MHPPPLYFRVEDGGVGGTQQGKAASYGERTRYNRWSVPRPELAGSPENIIRKRDGHAMRCMHYRRVFLLKDSLAPDKQ